jgi:hypothetical protein
LIHLAKLFQRRRFFLEINQSEKRIACYQTWPPQTILVSDWLFSKKSSPLKRLAK